MAWQLLTSLYSTQVNLHLQHHHGQCHSLLNETLTTSLPSVLFQVILLSIHIGGSTQDMPVAVAWVVLAAKLAAQLFLLLI